jgi:hypothetical protein
VNLLKRDTKHLALKSQLYKDQVMIFEKFQRETMQVKAKYDKPNKIYQRLGIWEIQ